MNDRENTPATHHLAQLNVARLRYPKDSPEVAEFIASLLPINMLAEASDGFIWRLQDDSGSAMSYTLFDEKTLPNMSVWRDRESLFKYVYNTGHTHYLSRRKEWFEMPKDQHMVLWWVPAGHTPDLAEAEAKLIHLREHGPSPEAFTFKKFYSVDGVLAE